MAEFTEKEVFEALGLGEQAQEAAVPAEGTGTETIEGGKEQEVAEPARDTNQDTLQVDAELTEDVEEPEDGADHASKSPMSPEQRKENAARRRQAEQQQAVDRAVSAAVEKERQRNDAAMKEFFAKAGLKNTITGEPITSMEQFQAWNAEFEQAKLSRELKNGKLTAEGLATAIGNHPVVKQAQVLIDQEAKTKQLQEEAAAKARIDQEIAKIHETDASINSVEDLFEASYGQELYEMVKRGYSITDAYYLLNRERLEQAKIEAARQQGINNARSKDHMSATAVPRGGGSVSVPAAELAMFRQFNPDATDAEIQEYYNRYIKK